MIQTQVNHYQAFKKSTHLLTEFTIPIAPSSLTPAHWTYETKSLKLLFAPLHDKENLLLPIIL